MNFEFGKVKATSSVEMSGSLVLAIVAMLVVLIAGFILLTVKLFQRFNNPSDVSRVRGLLLFDAAGKSLSIVSSGWMRWLFQKQTARTSGSCRSLL